MSPRRQISELPYSQKSTLLTAVYSDYIQWQVQVCGAGYWEKERGSSTPGTTPVSIKLNVLKLAKS